LGNCADTSCGATSKAKNAKAKAEVNNFFMVILMW
jgi:hypothetical protein